MVKKKVTDLLILFILAGIGVMLIWHQKAVSEAVIGSLRNCIYRIIPSLFAMTVLSTAISRSGIISKMLRRSKINADIFTAFIFGNIGGYPIGAKLLSEMVDNGRITQLQAEKALTFCYGSGPAFAAGVAGAAVFGDTRFGLAAFAAGFLSNLTLYAIFLISERKNVIHSKAYCEGFSTKLLIDSVNSATGAMTGICSMIVFFSALRAVLESLMPSATNMKYLPCILEISNISALSLRQGISLITVALLLSFGGLCVHMQIISIVGDRFSVKYFYLSRLIQLPLCGICAYVIERIMRRFGIVMTVTTKIRLSQSTSLIPIVCVAAMVFITLKEPSKRAD